MDRPLHDRPLPILAPARAVGALAVLTIVAVAVSVTLLLWNLRQRAIERERAETTALARLVVEQTGDAFAHTDAAMRMVIDRLQSPFGSQLPLDSLAVHFLLSANLSGLIQNSALIVDDAHGVVMSSSRAPVGQPISIADRAYFRAVARSARAGLYVDVPVQSRVTGHWTLHMSRRLDNPDGSLRGVVVAALRVNQIERLFADARAGSSRTVALYRDDGRLVASLPHRDSAIGEIQPDLGHVALAGAGIGYVSTLGDGGSTQSMAIAPVTGVPLFIAVSDDRAGALGAWRQTATPIAAGALLICAFIGVAAQLLALELRREGELNRALRQADERYRETVDAVMDAIVAVDASRRVLVFNPAAERMLGVPASRAIGSPLSDLPGGGSLDALFGGEPAARIDATAHRADGTAFPVEAGVSSHEVDGQRHLTAVLHDVSERQRREAQLREANAELRRLSSSLQTVREEERTRISRELHDDLGQQLTGLKLDLSWLSGRIRDGRQPAPENLDSMRHLLDGAIAAVRRISAELRPRILDDHDLAGAINWQASELARRSGLDVRLDLQTGNRAFDDATATALFRIVQESLTNIIRHAGATRVDIALHEGAGALLLSVTDDGVGFDPERHGSSIGLLSMRERAMALGGEFSITADARGGTRVAVHIPDAEQETS